MSSVLRSSARFMAELYLPILIPTYVARRLVAGGAEVFLYWACVFVIEDEHAVAVDVAAGEDHGVWDVDPEIAAEAVGAHPLAAVTAAWGDAIGVSLFGMRRF